MAKLDGWWETHPTLLTVSVHGGPDSNNDGLGDFIGFRQKFCFFKSIGITGFRFQHVGFYGDDYKWSGLVQQNWYRVDPHYGTMEDFEGLINDCNEEGFKIIMMAVPEYLGWYHPDYLAAKHAKENGIYDPRVDWFTWKDEDTVLTCWDRPAPNVSNSDYRKAFLQHIGFWMDKGIAGWDLDAVMTWHGLNIEALREITSYIVNRGGFVTAENMVLLNDITKYGGCNAGTGYLRHEFYNELKAIVEGKADHIRDALKVRSELKKLGMFPYQQFGDQSYEILTNSWFCHIHEMFKLQIAFNCSLPDQVWVLANAMTFSEIDRTIKKGPNSSGWGTIDWHAITEQESNPNSILSHFKLMFSLRTRYSALAVGEIEEVETNYHQDVFAAIRFSYSKQERALVIFNFSGQPRNVIVNLNGYGINKLVNILNGKEINAVPTLYQNEINLYGYKFYQIID